MASSFAGHAFARERVVDDGYFPPPPQTPISRLKVVDHTQDAETATINQRVRHEVERPSLVGILRDRHRCPRAQGPLSATTPAHCQPLILVYPVEPLPVLLLKVEQTPNKAFMQVEGRGISVPTPALLSMVDQVPTAQDLLLRYVHCSELQLAHSALANARYTMPQRLARWLLMCHDRLRDDDLSLTHEFLSLMLGVRRSGVTNEIHVLEGAHAIKASRGNIRIVDRQKLEEIAGGSYGIPEDEYERHIGFTIRRS